MAKKGGLAEEYYAHGYDISGDVGSIREAASPRGVLSVTAINKSAHERLLSYGDGRLGFNTWFDDAAVAEHIALSGLPTTDVLHLWCMSGTRGDPAASLNAKQVNYDWSRGADGSLEGSVDALADGVCLEWMVMLTAGLETVASAGTTTSIDSGTQAAAVTITSSSVASPTVITTATVHGLTSGDTVLIAGHTGSTPALDGSHTATVLTTTTYTVPVAVTVAGNGGTSTLTSTRNGAGAVLQTVDIGSGTPTVILQDSQDNSTFVTLISFTAVADTNEPTAERKTVAGVVDRYLRLNVTGTFTDLDCVVALRRGTADDDVAYA